MADEPEETEAGEPCAEDELEAERARREAEELRSFQRRADWWQQHQGAPAPPPPAAPADE